MSSWIGVCVGLMRNNDDVLLGCPCTRYCDMRARGGGVRDCDERGEEGSGDDEG